jgi:hypothetical protein
MAQTAPTIAQLRSVAPAASQCGDVNAFSCLKVVLPYSCEAAESYAIEADAAIALNATTATLVVSDSPVGAPIPSVADPFFLYAGTVLTFGLVEIKVLANAELNSTVGVPVTIAAAPAAVAIAATADLYNFHVIESVTSVDETASDESEDVTKNKDGIQKSEDVTSRGLTISITSTLNATDRGLWVAMHNLINNGGEKGLVSLYGLPGLLTVGQASFMEGTINRTAKQKAKLNARLMFSAPFKRFNLKSYENVATQAVLTEQARLWGYSAADFAQ